MNFIFKLLIAIGFCIGIFILLAIICQTFLLGLTFSGIIFYGSIIAIFKNWKYTLAVLLVWIAYFKLSNSYDIHNSLLIVSNIILTVLLLLLSAFTKNKDDESDEIKYRFKTCTDGNDTCRTVAGCFEDKYIEPNMKFVIDTINKFESGE